MKKTTIVLFLLLLTAGCIGLPWGGSKDELDFVPKSANALLIIKPSSILNDSDFASIYNSSEQMTSEMSRVEATTGLNPTKIDRIVMFFTLESFGQESEMYGGFIARGDINKDNILEKMRLNNVVNELSHDSKAMYEIVSKESPQNKTYLSFLDGNTMVGGSKNAVEDSIEVSNGRMESVKSRQKLASLYDKQETNSILIFLMETPQDMKREFNTSSQEIFSIRALSRMDSLAFSLVKKEKTVELKLTLLAEDAAGANEISKLFEKLFSTAKGLSPSGSTLESIIAKTKLEASGSEVSVSLSSTSDELEKVNEELNELAGGQT